MTTPTQAQIEAVMEMRLKKALEPFAAIEVPPNADDGTWVAKTIYCNNQVTAHSVREARAALTTAAEVEEPLMIFGEKLTPAQLVDATIERCALWHDEREKLMRARAVEAASGPCPLPDVSNAQDQVADWHKQSAAEIRKLKDQP